MYYFFSNFVVFFKLLSVPPSTSDPLIVLFSQDDADSLARDYMKHRDHQRGKTLTNGSASPNSLKVGELTKNRMNSVKTKPFLYITFMTKLSFFNVIIIIFLTVILLYSLFIPGVSEHAKRSVVLN